MCVRVRQTWSMEASRAVAGSSHDSAFFGTTANWKKGGGGLQWTADTLRHTYQEPQTHYEIKRFSEGNLGINQVAWDGLQENTNDAQRFETHLLYRARRLTLRLEK